MLLIIIKHRINTVQELKNTQRNFGVEIDVRTLGADLIIQHDPFEHGIKLVEWLKYFSHKFLIVNLKEDGLESYIIKLLEEHNISNFFFLDQSIPMLYKSSLAYPGICSTRISDIESVETALKINTGWVWLDSHSGNWDYLNEACLKLANTRIKKCFVSPELQRQNSEQELIELKALINKLSINFDAVCTKYPEKWA